jgi:hypothetical protein
MRRRRSEVKGRLTRERQTDKQQGGNGSVQPLHDSSSWLVFHKVNMAKLSQRLAARQAASIRQSLYDAASSARSEQALKNEPSRAYLLLAYGVDKASWPFAVCRKESINSAGRSRPCQGNFYSRCKQGDPVCSIPIPDQRTDESGFSFSAAAPLSFGSS